ncbi:tyrosine-type recombinase/integrase [Bradyrhizobium sp. sBnM-33]|uniref:tyrosine-type recombinase/integrase n=1 Tax=Bradyrhizobium sp. sBnM-33 TaxID=2831780 RepID=UPI001BCCFEAC|nr:tyrosine-type recombinase/integrase [Bradyrhizobium sp. sBnM-33]WOH48237.1 tyrosine-type recombinase/integrase [Bradyrhizobium sp. sBnM-33]
MALAAKSASGFDVDQARSDDKRALWTYTLLDAQGAAAAVRPEDRIRMVADGLSEADIEAVQRHLTMLRKNDLVPTKDHVLRQMIDGVEAVPTAMNFSVAQGTYFRGMKLALAEIDRRYGGQRVEDGDVVDRLLLSRSDPRLQVSSVEADREDRRRDPPEAEPAPVPQAVPMADFSKFAEDVIKLNDKNCHWDQKTQRQARSVSNLFIKFMIQDQGVHDLNSLRQSHAGKFVDFLFFEIYKHYGKSVRDEHLTIAQLREKGRSHGQGKKGECGLSSGTVNRHLTFLGQIFEYASARGLENLDKIDLSKLRAKSNKDTRDRDERRKLPIDRAHAIFRTAPFNNCASWDALEKPGGDGAQQIFHCALYFVPILIYYTGCRREEICGAMVDDVIFEKRETPYLHIAKNERRRIKNAQSQRNVPLHPEVIRLNFLAYVKAIKALGYKLLFPDLFSPTSRSPLGDRFYKQFKPILVAAGVTEEGLGSHAVRHLFGAQLKKKLVAVEDRADLLGHGGDTETSERYCEPHEIATLLEFVMKLPTITADLQPREVNLIPWVAEKQVAPFSQPSRAKRLL